MKSESRPAVFPSECGVALGVLFPAGGVAPEFRSSRRNADFSLILLIWWNLPSQLERVVSRPPPTAVPRACAMEANWKGKKGCKYVSVIMKAAYCVQGVAMQGEQTVLEHSPQSSFVLWLARA